MARYYKQWVLLCGFMLLAITGLAASPAHAAICSQAGAQGAAPASWQSYCWLDLTSYDDTTARSASGQNFSFSLADGSTLTFTLKTTSTAATGALATAAPSWTGAAVGNTSFLSIPGKPILYNNVAGATVTFNITSITIVPPPGVASVSDYAFVVADGESTDNGEYLEYTTNGAAWVLLDNVAPISGSNYPMLTGIGTSVARSSGNGLPSPIGAHILGSNKPTSVTALMKSGGLEGIMFAVRFASIKLNKTITGSRINASDQFDFSIRATSSGSVLASGTTTGSSNGPFTAAVISTASGIPITLTESMASGSTSALSRYRGLLTCTNATAGSPTVMPTNLVTTSYNFGTLNFGDIVSCSFNNAAYPHVSLGKVISAAGRIFPTDQFTLQVKQGASVLGTTTTSGTGTTVTNGSTGFIQMTAGTNSQLDELASGSTNISRYTKALSCSNAYAGSATVLPGAIATNFTPGYGDVISCTLTNTRDAANAVIKITKASQVISDGISAANPKAIPGATIRYNITVTNEGDAAVDASTIYLFDVLPANMTYSVTPFVTFTNGPTPSGLSTPALDTTRVVFSNQASGGTPYTYTPAGSLDGNVKGIRIRPNGTMAPSNGVNNPSFTVSYEMRIN